MSVCVLVCVLVCVCWCVCARVCAHAVHTSVIKEPVYAGVDGREWSEGGGDLSTQNCTANTRPAAGLPGDLQTVHTAEVWCIEGGNVKDRSVENTSYSMHYA